MKIAVPKETRAGEDRVALVPESCKKLIAKGVEVLVQSQAGLAAYFTDEAYQSVGATILADAATLLNTADFVLKVQPPTEAEIAQLRPGAMLLASLMPTRNLAAVRALAERKITSFSTDCIPRTTRAQTMDTLSSMANIAGYKAVVLAAVELPKYLPMFMTAAGTIFAAKVFVIGAGVAGLQAIATAKRLGANITATDVRPDVKEQIESVGGKWVGVQATEAAQDAGGYAKQLSEEYYRKQRELLAEQCATADVVITTALIGGVVAPKLITAEMVHKMRPGSIIVDLAADGGGNCELTRPGETVVVNGVKILAPVNFAATMPTHASTLYSRNLTAFVLEFWKDNAFQLNWEDDILKGAVITHDGEVRHAKTREALQGAGA